MSDMDLLFNQVASLEKLKLERDRDAAAASVRRRELEEQLSDAKRELAEAKKSLSIERQEAASLRSQSRTQEKILGQLKQTLKELKKEKAQLEETVEVEKKRSREEREVYLDRLNQFEGKARRFLKYFDNSDLVQQCLDKDRQIDALSKQVIDLSAGHDVKIGAINDEMGTALQKNADLADRLNKEEQEKTALKEKLDCAETTLKLRMADEKALLEFSEKQEAMQSAFEAALTAWHCHQCNAAVDMERFCAAVQQHLGSGDGDRCTNTQMDVEQPQE